MNTQHDITIQEWMRKIAIIFPFIINFNISKFPDIICKFNIDDFYVGMIKVKYNPEVNLFISDVKSKMRTNIINTIKRRNDEVKTMKDIIEQKL